MRTYNRIRRTLASAALLCQAAAAGHAANAQFLLEKGADVTLRPQNDKTALSVDEETGQPEVADLLRKAGAKA